MFKVNIRDIKSEGLQLTEQIPAEEIGLTKEDYLRFIVPLNVDVKLDKADDVVIARVKVDSRYASYCSRTLVDVERNWSDKFTIDIPIEEKTEYIELGEEIRQEVVMRVPMRVLSDDELNRDDHDIEIVADELKEESQPKMQQPFANLKLESE